MRRRVISLLMAIGLVMSVNVESMAQPLKQKLEDQKEQLQQKQNSYTQFQMDFEKLEISIEMLDVEIEGIYIAIDKAKQEMIVTEKKIEQNAKDIIIAENDIKDEEDLFNKRMRVMFINGADSYLEILFDSQGIEDFISRVENIKKIVEYDNEIISELGNKKKEIENIKTALSDNKSKILELKADNEKKLDKLSINKNKQQQLIVEAKKHEELYKEEIAKTENQLASTMNQIKDEEKEVARKELEIAKKKAEEKAASDAKANLVKKEDTKQETIPRPKPEVGNTQKPSPVSTNGLVAYAESFMGTPYEWGAVGVSTFDCSGFVQYVYAHFGMRIGRTTYDQIEDGKYVSRENLQPGDLVFFGTGSPHHVGIYVGDNIYIHAPRTGDVIKKSPLTRSDYLSARRIN